MKKFPIFRQLDSLDCGPTCLRMIIKYYGNDISLQELRNKMHISREGVSLLNISDAAESLGFRTLGVKISYEKLVNEVQLPCITFINDKHFAVLYKIKKDKLYLADPAVGSISYSKSEFAKIWLKGDDESESGIVLLLQTTPAFYNQTLTSNTSGVKTGLKYLFAYLSPYKNLIVQLFIGLFAGSLIQLILPFLTQAIIDVGIKTNDINFIYIILVGQLVMFLSRSVIDLIRRWILLHLSARINVSIISDFLIKLMKLPISYFEGNMLGDTLQRIEDHNRIERFLSTSTLNTFFSFFNLIIFGIVLFIYDENIFLVFIIFSFLYLSYILLFLKKRRILDYKKFSSLSENQNNVYQLITGMQEIKLNNCAKEKRWEWENVQAKLFKLNMDGVKLVQFQESGGLFINELKNIIITFISATAVMEGSMTLGMMLSILYIIGLLNSPINEFVSFVVDFQDAKLSLERISEIQNLEIEDDFITDSNVKDDFLDKNVDIIFKNVSFSYEGPNSPKALKNINLTIPNGKVTAIVGSSGSGKTTLMKILLKFYPHFEGQILLDNTDLSSINNNMWRERCGVVMQDGFVFSDTIARNISISDPIIDYKKIQYAMHIANISEFVSSLPLGLDTKIGNNGVGLSQGQRQRLLIARAVYKDPDFLFFDEATSALDANNERTIVDNLNSFFSNKTVVVIAHRLSTVRNADQIVVIENGEIIEIGTHLELTTIKGAYFRLVKNQLELSN